MKTRYDNLKTGAQVAIGLLVILLIGSIYFYKERMLFSDASFIAFKIINSGSLQTQVERHGAFVTQLFPLVASKLHLPIKVVLLLYSLSFNLFFLFVGWILYRLKQYPLTILLALYLTLYVSDTYFWTNNEVHQGVAWMFLDFGVLFFLYREYKDERRKFLWISLPVFIVLSFIAIYTHPLVMISFGFLWVFFVLAKQDFFSDRISIIYAFWVVLICVFKFLESQSNWYDGGLLHNITHTTLPAVLGTFKSSLGKDFWHAGFTNYWLLWLVFLAGAVQFFRRKKYVLLIYTSISCLFYFILICLTFYPSKPFYIESEWMSIAILGSVGFVYFVLPVLKRPYVLALLFVLFAVRIGYIGFSSRIFTQRVSFLESVVDKMNNWNTYKLVVINENDQWEDKLLLSWGLAYETALLSALKGQQPLKTMSYLKQEQIDQYGVPNTTRCMVSNFGLFCDNEWNRYYFNFDTAAAYKVILPGEWDQR
ncbi:MAG TPA: hypothetical protein VL098_03340 [Flavipsychrobacter sp.]|nr:hypothetical protein [Flavipsychrobacter sp.]